jgi:hypothetical protein
MAEERCGSCKFLLDTDKRPIGIGKRVGVCRRYPPSWRFDTLSSIFPDIYENSWCGEFVPKTY